MQTFNAIEMYTYIAATLNICWIDGWVNLISIITSTLCTYPWWNFTKKTFSSVAWCIRIYKIYVVCDPVKMLSKTWASVSTLQSQPPATHDWHFDVELDGDNAELRELELCRWHRVTAYNLLIIFFRSLCERLATWN